MKAKQYILSTEHMSVEGGRAWGVFLYGVRMPWDVTNIKRANYLSMIKKYFVIPMRTATSRVKVKVKVKFPLEQATKALLGSRGIALLFL